MLNLVVALPDIPSQFSSNGQLHHHHPQRRDDGGVSYPDTAPAGAGPAGRSGLSALADAELLGVRTPPWSNGAPTGSVRSRSADELLQMADEASYRPRGRGCAGPRTVGQRGPRQSARPGGQLETPPGHAPVVGADARVIEL